MVGLWRVGVIEMFVLVTRTGRITGTAAISATFEALTAATTAGDSAATTSDDAPNNTKDNETADDNDTNHGPSIE